MLGSESMAGDVASYGWLLGKVIVPVPQYVDYSYFQKVTFWKKRTVPVQYFFWKKRTDLCIYSILINM